MESTILRILLFTILPLLLGGIVIIFDRRTNSKERNIETLLIFLFGLGMGGSGIMSFFAHFFLADTVAELIGWETGSPFQLEIAFANLAMGVLGIVAVTRRDGFREAAVVAATIFSVGASVVHLMDIAATGNLAPGNTIQNFSNLARPALLIWLLIVSRRGENAPGTEIGTAAFDNWRIALNQATAPVTVLISTAFGIGFAIDNPWLITLIGVVIATAVLMFILARSPEHAITFK